MNAAVRKKAWQESEELAGRHATTMGEPRRRAWQPAANEVASRDYTAEAQGAKSLIEGYVAEIADGPTEVPNTRAGKVDLSQCVAPVVSIFPDIAQAYFISTQEWDGYVTDVGADEFEAVIYPVGKSEQFREDTVSVPLWLVDEDARHRVRTGAIFRLATGRQRRKRQIIHGARIYFRLAVDVRKQEGLDRGALEAFFGD